MHLSLETRSRQFLLHHASCDKPWLSMVDGFSSWGKRFFKFLACDFGSSNKNRPVSSLQKHAGKTTKTYKSIGRAGYGWLWLRWFYRETFSLCVAMLKANNCSCFFGGMTCGQELPDQSMTMHQFVGIKHGIKIPSNPFILHAVHQHLNKPWTLDIKNWFRAK